MNYLLALHFLKSLTNRQKKTLFYSEEWKRHGPEFAISAVLKKMIDGTSNWDNALLCMNEELVIIQNEGITLLTFVIFMGKCQKHFIMWIFFSGQMKCAKMLFQTLIMLK